MKREQKAQVIDEIAAQIADSEAIYAADYSGLSVSQAATLRARLREADAIFRIVKNTLSLRAAEKAGAEQVKELVEGPTAFTFVRGDAALAAKALDSFARQERVLDVRGGVVGGETLTADAVRQLARLPARDQLNAQIAGVVAAPLTGLVRGLGGLLSGLAVALGQIREKKEAEAPPEEAPAAAPESGQESAAAEAAPEAANEEVAEAADEGEEPESEPAAEEKTEASEEKEAE
jgi:large subunit ribosomal protein L10